MHTHVTMQTCVCGSAGTQTCGKCRTTTYCSKSCQTTDWPTHKKNCADAIFCEAHLARIEHLLGGDLCVMLHQCGAGTIDVEINENFVDFCHNWNNTHHLKMCHLRWRVGDPCVLFRFANTTFRRPVPVGVPVHAHPVRGHEWTVRLST